MKAYNVVTGFFLTLFLTLPLNLHAEDRTSSTSTSLDDLSDNEAAGLVFMREEEKLARDVYIYLYETWGQKTFDNIAVSEQAHTDAMLELLHKYGIDDPVGDNPEGIFVDQNLQGLYDTLTATGSASLIDALLVGAAIEEIDLIDIKHLVDRRYRLLVEIVTNAVHRCRVVTITAAGDTAHVNLAKPRTTGTTLRRKGNGRQEINEIFESTDVQVFQLLVAQHLNGNSHILKALISLLGRYDDFVNCSSLVLCMRRRHDHRRNRRTRQSQ